MKVCERFDLLRFDLSPQMVVGAKSLLALALFASTARAETCITQSGLADAERAGLAEAAGSFSAKIQSNDAAFIRAFSIAELQKDFGSLQYLIGVTSPKLAAGTLTVDQIYELDATTLKRNADGSALDAQFFCSLNRSTMEADFLIPALPPGKYGFAMVTVASPSAGVPWRLSMLLRQEQGKWLLAGFYPKPLTAAGHDGLWYWTQARLMAREKQLWNAWLYYQAATMLLRPADFVLSTHLDKLHTEATTSAPPALSEGISADSPLVVKSPDGMEYHFTALGVDDSLGQSALDITVHLRADAQADPVAARKRNTDATIALLSAYPEMRKLFHGVRMVADTAGQSSFATELPMAEIK